MNIHIYDVIREPMITEKVAKMAELENKYVFKVHKASNKKQIKSAVEKIFNVNVVKVNTLNQVGKWRRVRFQPGQTAAWKKAIVTLKKGDKIDITA